VAVFGSDTAPEAGAPDLEVTSDMVDAGVIAYYGNSGWGWDNPGDRELREMMRSIFVAMAGKSELIRE
jgi:hypothetical protein